jgi:teichuronic acid biosynthesis glycosyltransferase TuaC
MDTRRDGPRTVLVVTALYPHPADPAEGIFVRNQIASLATLDPNLRFEVLYLQGSGMLRYVTGLWRTLAATLRNRYLLVHAHYGLAGLAAILRYRTPLVITLHGSDVNIPWQRRLTRAACRFAGAVIVVSDDLQALLGRPATVIAVGVDLKLFREMDRAGCRAQLGWPADAPIVLFPSDPARRIKRYDLFEAAVAELRARGRPVHVVTLAGSRYAYEDMPIVLNAANLVLLTSDTEGSPNVVKEALACNTPVVSVDAGDVAQRIGPVAGCYLAARDPRDLADKMALALDGPARVAGRAQVRDVDEALIARRILDVYRQVHTAVGAPAVERTADSSKPPI